MTALRVDLSAAPVAEAAWRLPGGVSSKFRLGITPTPMVFERADGAHSAGETR